ncbi:MAG: hypothetical protein ACE5GV_17975 [Candidatus Scalindua sp.]
MKILENKFEIHDAVTETIQQNEEDNSSTGKNQLKIMSCHGPDHKDIGLMSLLGPVFIKIIKSPNWIFHEVTGIYSEERLVEKIIQCEKVIEAEDFLLKAFITVNSPTVICPLIIGENDVLLGIYHEQDKTPKKAIHLQGKECFDLFNSYLTSLWVKPNNYTLRDDRGINNDQVAMKKNKLSRIINIENKENTP